MSQLFLRFTPPSCLWASAPIPACGMVLCAVMMLSCGPPGETVRRQPSQLAQIDRSSACQPNLWIGILDENGQGQEEQRPESAIEEGTAQGTRPDAAQEPSDPTPLRCPEGWQWAFDSGASQPPPPGLQRFCTYEGQGDPRQSYRSLENPYFKLSPFESIERVCRIVGPAAETLFPRTGLADALRDRFQREARGSLAAPAAAAAAPAPVRLVVVDSVEDNADRPQERECPATSQEGQLECSPHGEVLLRLGRRLLCPGDDCGPLEITARRVLHWTHEIRAADQPARPVRLDVTDAPGTVGGGSSGTPLDLAQAIRREIRESAQQSPGPSVVLNLSVGWEAVHAPLSSASAAVVRAALEDAVCRGALVIAAAGNRVSGPPDLERPLFPAAFEQVPAPDQGRCRRLLEGSAQPAPDSNTDYRPLVFAAGGVQEDGRPLSNSRPNATPRLTAFGDHASVLSSSQPPQLKILTGTSVSALVVSAAAVRRWSRGIGQTAFDLMESLRRESPDSAAPVDFCLDPRTNCPKRQLAKRVYAGSAPALLAARRRPPFKPAFNETLLGRRAQPLDPLFTSDLPNCRPRILQSSVPPGQQAELCPQRLFDIRSQPWLGPQPGSNHNPACSYSKGSPGTLVLEFDPCFRVEGKPARLDDLTLVVDDQAFRLPSDGFLLGDPSRPCPLQDDPRRVQIVLTDFILDDPPQPMYLAATVNGRQATLTPILQVIE